MRRPVSGRPPRLRMPPGATDTQMHAYLPGFPALPGGPPAPEGNAAPADYRSVMAWLGIGRVVVTQGNAHQRDNANLLACLADFGPCARGVAVIDRETTDAEMARLHAAGVRGARIMDLPGGAVGLAALEAVDARALAFGWTLAVQFDGRTILDHLPRLAAIRSRWILDHHGKFFGGVAADDARVDAVRRRLDGGRAHYKIAGCYESSGVGGPDYADVGAVTRAMVAHAPERVVWGSNWPHNLATSAADYPDDAALADLLLDWAPREADRAHILVETPARLFDFRGAVS